MSRRRFQEGSVKLISTLAGKYWQGRFHERVLAEGQEIVRNRKVNLGPYPLIPTERAAKRALQPHLDKVNDAHYQPRQLSTFSAFAERWKALVLVHHKPSGAASAKSCINNWLVPFLGDCRLSDITGEDIQRLISWATEKQYSPKSVQNMVGLMRLMWKSARSWNYVSHDPFFGLCLPAKIKTEAPYFTPEQMALIVRAAEGEAKTLFWIQAETGIRAGEALGLSPSDFDLERGTLEVKRSVWRRKIQTPKTKNAYRRFILSPSLVEYLKLVLASWQPNEHGLLFVDENGQPRSYNTVIKQWLYPLVDRLKVPRFGGAASADHRAATHAFRHGNSSIMGSLNVPDAVRMKRLGHASIQTTHGYTHAFSADEKDLAEKMGEFFRPNSVQ